MPDWELDPERLATTAQDGSRVYLHTAEVRGKLRNLRSRVYDVLLIIFLCIPWVRINGEPMLLLDLPRRHFSILGVTFWGDDAPILFLLFLLFVVTIGLITALFGRGWCGWACPQTVFIDRLFVRIERWIEGDAAAQRKLDAAPMNFAKLSRRGFKWFLFLCVSLVITHSFLAYFVGTERLAKMVTHSPFEHPSSFLVIAFTTAIILFDFGWFREQFCIIACPYGRLQSVLMDDHSLIVAYDTKRGEPRRQKGMAPSQHGDCVNCYRCVQVCPTGIDIRRGVQMECIACTACIDACDEVMTKIKKPLGLIRYDTEAGLSKQTVRHVRLRTLIYAAVIFAAAAVLVFVLSTREAMKINFVRAQGNPFELIRDGKDVINHYKVEIHNEDARDANVDFLLPESLMKENLSLVVPVSSLLVEAGKSVRADLFVTFPRSFLTRGQTSIPVLMNSHFAGRESRQMIKKIPLVGPAGDSENNELKESRERS